MEERGSGSALIEEIGYDGLLPGFFHALWLKGRDKHCSTLEGVRILHTVVYRFTKPTAWYFLSKDGTIKRKGKKNLNSATIYDEFMKAAKPNVQSGVAAVFVTPSQEGRINCKYIKAGDLLATLQDCPSVTGLLQVYADPKQHDGNSMRNSVYNVNWTGHACNIEFVTNRFDMTDPAVPLDQRLDLSNALSLNAVTNRTRRMLVEASSAIARHLTRLYACNVTHLNLHFRKDTQNRLWVLHCSGIKVLEPGNTLRELSLLDAKTKSGLLLKTKWTARRDHAAPATCRLCLKEKPGGECSSVKRRAALFSLQVLEHFTDPATARKSFSDSLLPGAAGLPKCVRMIDGGADASDFRTPSGREEWLDARVTCCFDCINSLVNYTSAIQVDGDGKIRRPFGAHSLPAMPSSGKRSLRSLRGAAGSPDPLGGAAAGGVSPPSAAGPPLRANPISPDATSYGLSDAPASLSTTPPHSEAALSARKGSLGGRSQLVV